VTTLRIVTVRTIYGPESTRGNLIVDGVNLGYTIEDVVRPAGAAKVHGRTAIPAGIYQVGMHSSPRFGKRLPHLLDVPGFQYILSHGGNRAIDTEGCIIVAAKYKAADWIFESISDLIARTVDSALKSGRQVTWEVIDTVH
jgi:hypothetical protein